MSSPLEYHIHVRHSIPASLALLAVLALPLAFVSASHAQINGAPASVTSQGFGGRAINVPQQASPQSGLVASLPTRALRSRRRTRLAPATDIININATISTRLPWCMASPFPTPSILAQLMRGTPRTRMPATTTPIIRADPRSLIAADRAPHLTSRRSAALPGLTLFRMPMSPPLIRNRRKSRPCSCSRMAASWSSETTRSSDRRSSI